MDKQHLFSEYKTYTNRKSIKYFNIWGALWKLCLTFSLYLIVLVFIISDQTVEKGEYNIIGLYSKIDIDDNEKIVTKKLYYIATKSEIDENIKIGLYDYYTIPCDKLNKQKRYKAGDKIRILEEFKTDSVMVNDFQQALLIVGFALLLVTGLLAAFN